jgi:hypothetical protein
VYVQPELDRRQWRRFLGDAAADDPMIRQS